MSLDIYDKAPELDSGRSHIVRTRYGIEFDAANDYWPVNEKQGVDMSAVRSMIDPALWPGMEATFRHVFTKYSWSTLSLYRMALRHFQKACFPGGSITKWQLTDFRRYRKVLLTEFGHEDYLRSLRSLLVNWHGQHTGEVSAQLVAELKAMRLKGADTGRAVRTMGPDEGPLTPAELHNLLQDLSDSAEAGKLDIEEFSLAYFHICTGRRPIQSATMKCKDVFEEIGDREPGFPDGRPLHLLVIPRAKQRGHVFRETRRAIDLTPDNFQVFRVQRMSVEHTFTALLESKGWDIQPADLEVFLAELPLYPSWTAIMEAVELATQMRQNGEHGKALQALQLDARTVAWHLTSSAVSARLAKICRTIHAKDGDGKLLHLTPARLRHTKGTSLAREGLSATLIAWLLDHSTSRSAQIYVDNLPEHAAEIDRAVSNSPTLMRFASAFRGRLVDSETEAVAGDNPRSRIAYQGTNAATCGHLKQCGLDGGIPHACYTCSHFQPWLDGPHGEFLQELEAERANAIAALGPDSPVAKRRDKLIGAVQHVIKLCQHRRDELENAAVTRRLA